MKVTVTEVLALNESAISKLDNDQLQQARVILKYACGAARYAAVIADCAEFDTTREDTREEQLRLVDMEMRRRGLVAFAIAPPRTSTPAPK